MRTKTDETLIVAPDNTAQVALTFDDNRLASSLFGQYGQNLALIERRLGVVATSRGNQVTLEGPREACEQARRVLETLYERLTRGDEVAQGDVDGAVRLALSQGLAVRFRSRRRHGKISKRSICASAGCAPAPRRRMPMCARSSATRWFSPPARPAPARPGLRLLTPCNCSSARKSIASCCRARRSKPASGSAFCPATCARRSIPICGRSTTRSTT